MMDSIIRSYKTNSSANSTFVFKIFPSNTNRKDFNIIMIKFISRFNYIIAMWFSSACVKHCCQIHILHNFTLNFSVKLFLHYIKINFFIAAVKMITVILPGKYSTQNATTANTYMFMKLAT